MVRIVYAQTVLPEDVLEELKRKTGATSIKDALRVAVEHYLKCQHVGEVD